MNCFAIDVVKIISAKEMIICELDTPEWTNKKSYETSMNYEVIDFIKIIITQDHD